MSSSIKSSAPLGARMHPGAPGIVLFISILTFPLSLFAAAPLMAENADNTMSPQAPEQSMLSASETVAVDQGMTAAEPVMVSSDLEVLKAAVSVSQPGLDLEKYGGESTGMIETGGVPIQPGHDQLAMLAAGIVRAGGQHRSDSTAASEASDAGDKRLAGASRDVPGEPVDNAGGFSTQQMGQETKPHVAFVNQAVEKSALQHIPIAVWLALIALIGLVPVSRRRVTHTRSMGHQ